ncbi:MAG: TonB-dependent receptor [Tannerellaceae bacterium]|nr:TonB-dependent receptor [Tannerellaceae bacterium]
MLTCSAALFAQQSKSVTGTVLDAATGEPLIGVTVIEPGTTNGTVTDLDGRFALDVNGNSLSFSYVGYTTQVVNVAQSTVLNIRLSSDIELDEVVVVGYGVQRKSDLTGAISSISGKELQNQAAANVSNLLAGKAAGVFVSSSSGQPGSSAVVRIRGLGTVNDNNPLYVVDGQFMDDINSVNPADIDRIEILKDASALAIYGSRGANGVIIVTTKKGVSGQTSINLDISLGIKNAYKSFDMMNSDQYYNYIMASRVNDSNWDNTGATGMAYNFTQLYKRGYNTNWWKEATQTGFTQNYNLSIQKGSDTSRTVMSLGYLGEEGTIITTNFNRVSLRLGQEYDLGDRITVGANVNLAQMRQRTDQALGTFSNILKAEPFTPVINPLVDPNSENYEYNKYAPTEWTFEKNPVAELELPNRYNDKLNVFGNLFADVRLFKGLTYRFQYSFEKNSDKYHNFMPYYVNTFTDYVMTDKEGKISNNRPSLEESETKVFNQLIENRLNYNNKFGDHLFDVMGAITYEKNDNQSFGGYGAGAIGNDDIYEVLDAHPESMRTFGARASTSMLSYLARLNYSYDNRYLVTASFRADGSSAFAKNNRWGYFPSVSLGWRITNEQFFKNLNTENWLDDMKIRVGWGRNGNARVDQNAALTLVGSDIDDQWSFDGNTFNQGYYLKYTGNKDVKWEISEQVNVGLDATLFSLSNNTLTMSMDYYVKTTRDILLPFQLPSFGGFTNDPYINAGKIENKGFDFTANYTHAKHQDFSFNVGINLSTYKTKIKSLSVGEYGLDYLSGDNGRSYLNGPFNQFYGYKMIGIFQNQAEIDNYVDAHGNKIQPQAEPGDFKFANLNNDDPLNDDDRTIIGDPNPDLIYGLNLGFVYKNFDLSMFFQGTIGNDIWNVAKGDLAVPTYQNALAEAYTNAWTREGDHTKYPRITSTDPNSNFRGSSFYIENGSYLRLQNIQLGYNIPAALLNRTKAISSLRLFVSAQNLFTITGYTGLDPEVGVDEPLKMGVGTVRYPTPRTFLFGVNLQF